MQCNICPRDCNVDRGQSVGYCGAGRLPQVARCALHHFEEPPISGTRGSGTLFFCGCNMRCIFCQNSRISTAFVGDRYDPAGLVGLFYRLAAQGAHNINLVTPTIFTPILAEAMAMAKKQGFSLPFVWNSNAYEKADTLRALDGLVDIYLPDCKYPSEGEGLAQDYSDAPRYFDCASKAILQMQAQVGELQITDGIARKGLLLRHLVLPCHINQTKAVLDFVYSALGASTHLSLMRQYTPMYKALHHKQLGRTLTHKEYARAADYAQILGFKNLYLQDAASASADYTPDFVPTVLGMGAQTGS